MVHQTPETADHRRVPGDRKEPPLSLRLRMGAQEAIYRTGLLSGFDVIGEENLDDTDGKAAILAVDHVYDENLPLATIVASKHMDLAITGQSTHRRLETPQGILGFGTYLMMADRFIGVDTKWDPAKGHRVNFFTPSDTVPMLDALDDGKSLVVATHSPESTRPGKPFRPGYIGGLLALQSQAPIIPMAVRTEFTGKQRRNVTVVAGESYKIAPYDDIDAFLEAYAKRSKDSNSLSTAEVSLVRSGLQRIKSAGKEVFDRTNALLGDQPADSHK